LRGADIGYGSEEQAVDAVLPDVRPRGRVPEPAAAPAPPPGSLARSIEPIALGPEPAAESPAGRALAPPEEAPPTAAEVAAAAAAQDLERALALYHRLPDTERTALPIGTHILLGRAAAARQDYQLAVRALRAATAVAPADAEAPRAWVLRARVYADKLGDRATAARVYQHVVAQYPGTKAAAFARSQIPPATEC
jgi:tetratricopeptide (TPR) repeat protein